MSVKWVEYKGKRILYSDYRGLTRQEMLDNLDEAARILADEPGACLTLVNYIGVSGTRDYMDRVKRLGKEVLVRKTAKQAILGITGMKVIFLYAYNKVTGGHAMTFDNEQDAFEWLVVDGHDKG